MPGAKLLNNFTCTDRVKTNAPEPKKCFCLPAVGVAIELNSAFFQLL